MRTIDRRQIAADWARRGFSCELLAEAVYDGLLASFSRGFFP
jgi:hypothetical protein